MVAIVFAIVVVGGALWALSVFARSDLRRYGSIALSALEEEIRPHAAEHQRIDEHAAGDEDDDEGGPPQPTTLAPQPEAQKTQPG